MQAAPQHGLRSKSQQLLLAFLLCSAAASAQVTVGENLNMKMTEEIGYGYSANFGNQPNSSSHNQGINSTGDLNGYYFNPNFISFHLHPYYDRDQENTESQNVVRSTGIGAMANFFGGSHFPGSISFGKDFSANSEFLVAGIPTVNTDSANQTFAITWSALIPKWPTLTANYSVASSTAFLEGLDDSHSGSRNFNLTSTYQLSGWSLHGNFNHNSSDFSAPGFLLAEPITGSGSGTSYGLSAGHRLPLRGSFGLGWSHSNFEGSGGTDWSSDYLTASNSFMPWNRITLFQNANYTTNLAVLLSDTALNGVTVAALRSESDSQGFSYNAGGSIDVGHGFSVGAQYTYRLQWLLGQRFQDSRYGANVNYHNATRLFGMLYFGLGVIDTVTQDGNSGTGLNATVGISRRFGRWETSGDFNYFQNLQTLGTTALTSSYMFGGSVKRKVTNDLRVALGYRGSHSGLVAVDGSRNRGESASGTISWRKFNFGGSYSESDGTAVFTSAGVLTPTPVGSLLTDEFMLFNGRSWSANASTSFFRHLSLASGYSQFRSETNRLDQALLDRGNRYNFRTEYRLRKFTFVGGYNRSWQDVSTLPQGPRIVNSYYMSVLRWFNVF
ncbi:MAG TPA: hypothetical protein VHN74_14655 [Candidatus Angelobacter sp.]|jgi:hypothetical protein|nr:hypothetical protein [Candidatus Angelobacter sp.]